MRLTKRQLKKIIREEYSRLKRRGLIRENNSQFRGLIDALTGDDKEVMVQAVNDGISQGLFDVLQNYEQNAEGFYGMGSDGTETTWKLETSADFWNELIEAIRANPKSRRDAIVHKSSMRTNDNIDFAIYAQDDPKVWKAYKFTVVVVDKEKYFKDVWNDGQLSPTRSIREEYSRLKRRGLIRESWDDESIGQYADAMSTAYGQSPQGKGSIEDIIDLCVEECERNPEADVETVCERWLSSYGIPYDQYQMVIDAVYSRL